MPIADEIRNHFDRVAGETRKAASYLAVSRAPLRVPNFTQRWEESDCSEALHYTRDGMHMAFAITLAAIYDRRRDAVALPRLIRKLGEHPSQYALAERRRITLDSVVSGVGLAARRFARIQALSAHEALRELRHNVLAHHGSDTISHGATVGPLKRLMVRTVVLVDELGVVIKGQLEGNAGLVREVLLQSAGVWAHGMDADPYGDLSQHGP